MTNRSTRALAALSLIAICGGAYAQDTGFAWELEVELGNEQTYDSDDPANEIRDTFATVTFGAAYTFSNGVELFSTLVGESVTDPVADRSFDDLGLYVEELGVRFGAGPATFTLGKTAPAFGSAWDNAAGYFGDALAGDYELVEQISLLADIAVGETGTLSFGVFYAEETNLSRSIGFDRGRNDSAAGGAGNTGQFDNVAVQWTQDLGDTYYHVGARFLSAGAGDLDDETGVVAGLGHSLDTGIDLFAELAVFQNFGGGADDATFATLNAAYGLGQLTLSGTYARRDLDTGGVTDLISVGADYEVMNGLVIGGALAHVDNAGVSDQVLGVNLVWTLGS